MTLVFYFAENVAWYLIIWLILYCIAENIFANARKKEHKKSLLRLEELRESYDTNAKELAQIRLIAQMQFTKPPTQTPEPPQTSDPV